MIRIERCESQEIWDNEVLVRGGHPLQLWGWGEVKAKGGWRVDRVFVRENETIIGQCQILLRALPWPLKYFAYVPRGPVAEQGSREAALSAVANYSKETYGAVSLMIEPDWEAMPPAKGWRRSPNPILMAKTLVLDLSLTEEELQGRMAKKTRQYIRKSEKSGVEVRLAESLEDVRSCLEIYKDTARRAGFPLHEDKYYEDIFHTLGSHSQIFMAMHEGRAVAFLWLVLSEQTAFELYGGMNTEGQQLRANYMLKWDAIRRTKEWGVRLYDMNGLLNDGVSKFKRSFADHETLLAGSYEKPLSIWYPLWAKGLPAAKKVIRTIKR